MHNNETKKQEVITDFLNFYHTHNDVSYSLIKNEDQKLISRIERTFGNVHNLCAHLGIDDDKLTPLTKEDLVEGLFFLKQNSKISTVEMRKHFGLRFERTIKQIYGTLDNGFIELGFESDVVRWSEEDIIAKILQYKNKNEDLNYANMIIVDSALVSATTKAFDMGWNEFLYTNNIEFDPKRRKFSRDFIIEKLHDIYQSENRITPSVVKMCDNGLDAGVREYFGSYENALIEMGLNPDEHLNHHNLQSQGFRFERTFKKVVDALGIKHEYNKYSNGFRPDFQLENNIWMDCKLSSWSAFFDKTFEKYLPHCNKLIIVYLRGKQITKKQENIEIRNVDYYFEELIKIGRQDLIDELERIKIDVENIQNTA